MSDSAKGNGPADSDRKLSLMAALIAKVMIPIGALVALGMTAFTTFRGASQILPAVYLAAGMTVVAIFILVASSYFLGKATSDWFLGRAGATDGGRFASVAKYTAILSLYLMTFGACWFFSFATYFNWVNARGQDRETTANNATQLVSVIIPPLRAEVTGIGVEVHRTFNAEADVVSYRKLLTDVVAQAAAPEFANRVNAGIRANAERIAAQESAGAEADRSAAARLLANAREVKRAAETTLRTREQDLAAAVDRHPKLQAAHREEMDLANRTSLPANGEPYRLTRSEACRFERPRGPGACAREILAASALTEKIIEEAPRQIDEAKQKREQAERDEQRHNAALDDARKRLADIETRRSEAASGLLNINTVAQRLKISLDGFDRQASVAGFEELARACSSLRDGLPIETDLAGRKPRDIDCRPEPVLRLTQRVADRRVILNGFHQRCGESIDDRIEVIVKDMRRRLDGAEADARRVALGEMLDRVRNEIVQPCINEAGRAGVATSNATQEMISFVERNSARQDELSQAVRAIQTMFGIDRLGRTTAPHIIAGAFAAVQELYFLGAKLLYDLLTITRRNRRRSTEGELASVSVDWAPRSSDPPDVGAIKFILARMNHKGRRGGALRIADVTTEGVERQENIKARLRTLLRDGLASKRLLQRDYFISSDGVADMERIVIDHYSNKPIVDRRSPQAFVGGLPIEESHSLPPAENDLRLIGEHEEPHTRGRQQPAAEESRREVPRTFLGVDYGPTVSR